MARDETEFRGGKLDQRDRWFGLQREADFPAFRVWWHRHGKKVYGRDIEDRRQAGEAYLEWVQLGRPKAR